MAGNARSEHLSVIKDLLHQWNQKSRSCRTLQQLSLEAVATTLWGNIDRKMEKIYLEEKHYEHYRYLQDETEKMQLEVLNDAKPFIPKRFHQDLDYALTVKITQIRNAEEDIYQLHRISGANHRIRRHDVCWSSRGVIDLLPTGRLQMKRILESSVEFALSEACLYCSEDDVIRLWETGKDSSDFLHFREKNGWFVEYWESFVARKIISSAKMENTMLNCIPAMYEKGNCFAMEYFWSKLDSNGRNNVITKWSRKMTNYFSITHVEVVYFLVSRATESQLSFLMESKLFQVLNALLCTTHPESKLFTMTVIERISGFIDDMERGILVIGLMYRRSALFYKDLLLVLWKGGSAKFRLKIIRSNYFLFLSLFKMSRGSRLILIAMFEGVTEAERLKFLQYEIYTICRHILLEPLVVEEFLREFLRSEDFIVPFKRKLAEFAMRCKSFTKWLTNQDAYERYYDFFKLSDEEMIEFKKEFCRVVYIDLWLYETQMSATAVDKFLSWCLLPDADVQKLRKSIGLVSSTD